MDYAKLLKRAQSQLPTEVLKHERFEVPRPRSFFIGMRTIFINFKEVCEILNRKPHRLLKYLSGEMATAANMQGNRAIFQGKFRNDTFERLIQRYVKEFVFCPVCKGPDTKIVKEKRLRFLRCEACGAKSAIKSV